MRILVLNNLFPPHVLGGYEIACRNVAIALRERGHVVEVLSTHAPIATPDDPPWLHRVRSWPLFISPRLRPDGRLHCYFSAPAWAWSSPPLAGA